MNLCHVKVRKNLELETLCEDNLVSTHFLEKLLLVHNEICQGNCAALCNYFVSSLGMA